MGVALPRPSRWPQVAEKIIKILIDHKLQNGEGILKKYPKIPKFNFSEKMGVALPRPSGWPEVAEKILKIFIDHNLQNGEGILKKFPNLIFPKKWAWPSHAPTDGQKFFCLFFQLLSYFSPSNGKIIFMLTWSWAHGQPDRQTDRQPDRYIYILIRRIIYSKMTKNYYPFPTLCMGLITILP